MITFKQRAKKEHNQALLSVESKEKIHLDLFSLPFLNESTQMKYYLQTVRS